MNARWSLLFMLFFILLSTLNPAIYGAEGEENFDLNNEFLKAIKDGQSIEVVRKFLEEGADPNYKYAGYGHTLPLKQAAIGRRDRELIELLLDKGAEPTGSDIYRYMLYGCRLDIIELLLENGADANYQLNDMYDMYELTREEIAENQLGIETDLLGGSRDPLLTLAVEAGRKELVELLIEYGAEVNVESGFMNTATTPLISAVRNQERPELVRILIRAGADVNQSVNSGYTPLMAAAESGNFDACQTLLIFIADVNAHENLQMSALKSAVLRGDLEIVSLLVEAGADLDMLYSERKNILHLAASYCPDPEIAAYLIEKGVEPLSIDMYNRTPYQLAIIYENNTEVLSKLAGYGGDQILSGWFSEYIQERPPAEDDMRHYKFTADGKHLLTVDLADNIRQIRVWRSYQGDYFLTKLEFNVRENSGLAAYDLDHNITLSEDGNILIVRNLQNNKFHIEGQCFAVYADSTFKEAVNINRVSLDLAQKHEKWIDMFVGFPEGGKLHLMKMVLRTNDFYPYLRKSKEKIIGLEEFKKDISGEIDLKLQHSREGKYLLVNILEDIGDGYRKIKGAVLIDGESLEVASIVEIDQNAAGFAGAEIAYLKPDPYQEKIYFIIKKAEDYLATSIEIKDLVVDGTINNYIDPSDNFESRFCTGFAFTGSGEMLAYNNSHLLEYDAGSEKLNLMQENTLSDKIITASYDKAENKWLLLTDKGLIRRDVISREEAAVRSIFEEAAGLLEAGFNKQYLEKAREAMLLDVNNENFGSAFYKELLSHGFAYQDIGEMLILHYQLLLKEEKTELIKQGITLRLLEYGLFAERAGQRGLVKQAAERLKSLSADSEFADYRFTMELTAGLLNAVYLAAGDNPARAYDYLLEKDLFSQEKLEKAKLPLLRHLKQLPMIWQSLFIDSKKISYLTGLPADEASQIVYKKAVMLPYPDLNGNIIEAVRGIEQQGREENDFAKSSSNGAGEEESGSTGSQGTVLD